jgi:hypothetical protein
MTYLDHAASGENRRLGDLAPKLIVIGAALGGGGILASLLIGQLDAPERFYRPYLTAFMFVLSLSLGAMFFVLIQHLTKAGWSVTLRRLAEGIACNLMWLWLLFIPIALGMLWSETTRLYSWAIDANVAGSEVLQHKAAYLNPGFWLLRAGVFFAVWFIIARVLFRASAAQDLTGDVSLTYRLQRFAAPAIILYALTQSFAGIDWMMSLEPEWFSTMFGVYFFAGSACGFFALLIIIVYLLQRSGRLTRSITIEHYQDLGKGLFAFGIVFWAYIAYSQFMLIWYGNIPEETGWFLVRHFGDWAGLSLLLLFGHFVGPFLILISKHPKRRRGVLAAAAGWMLLMHFIDLYWLIMPHLPAERAGVIHDGTVTRFSEAAAAFSDLTLGFSAVHVTALIGLLGLFIAGAAMRLRHVSLIPTGDPRLGEAMAFENM